MRSFSPLFAALCLGSMLLPACSGGSAKLQGQPAPEAAAGPAVPAGQQGGFGLELPVDFLRPWEEVDASGRIVPPAGWLATERGASSIDEDTEFVTGAMRDSAVGDVTDLGQASALSSGAGELSYATYRVPLGGAEPGVVALDLNLHERAGGGLGGCFVGVANFASRRWEWHGPFRDHHLRISTGAALDAGASYVSALGSAYVAVAAWDGAAFDVVGLGLQPSAPADNTAPQTPQGLSATPVAGGLELQWNDVLAADLAGYRIYYRNTDFDDPDNSGVRSLPALEGTTRTVLSGISGNTFVRIAAVDYSGNESGLSGGVNGAPLPAAASYLLLDSSATGVPTGAAAQLDVSGADSFDLDLDGDGSFELVDQPAGSYGIDTSAPGIIRPRARGSDDEGGFVAYGGVSLIVAANFPPVARLTVNPPVGTLWGGDTLDVVFDASGSTDDSGGPLEYAYDPNGDGVFGSFSGSTVANRSINSPGVYLGAVQVRDSGGLSGYGYCVLDVRQAAGFDSQVVDTRSDTGLQANAAIINGTPAIVYSINITGGVTYVRALDPYGRFWSKPVDIVTPLVPSIYIDLAQIGGRPAIAYHDHVDDTLSYVRALDANGDSPADWAISHIDIAALVSTDGVTMAEINGNPAVAWEDGGGNILYKRASGDGDSVTHWVAMPAVVDAGSGAATPHDLQVVSGNPAMLFSASGDVMYERSSSTSGAGDPAWAAAAVNLSTPLLFNSDFASLAIVGGRPAVAFTTSDNKVFYCRAGNTTGQLSGNWNAPLEAASINGTYNAQLAELNGRPGIFFGAYVHLVPQIHCVLAPDAAGSSWTAPHLATDNDDDVGDGDYLSLLSTPGWVGMATQQNGVQQRLQFNSLQYD